ncbi:hypothetical protein CVV65_10600 [Kyrpidia spormannii]|uniref:4-vinyl reductase 4VR domain-containing protein n=1 Tax=Kyrpidia spormannii TaxID=2055160 RepID=A0A2K8N7J4_9BACL|nr:XylR N-terminal domain-containing protein [Kyrpidia spormannii]ATY85316.1 hypothetical protein CVV65_10600 [Kyrpidia spormannii]
MKAQSLVFEHVIDIHPRTGQITMNGRRMALMSTEALGILRRDLVSTLGMDRAKGFLMRYGWSCGRNDARAIRSLFEWESFEELILAGPALHTLEGVVTVEPGEMRVDSTIGEVYFTGEWRHSFEAEEHVRHFGVDEEPVCWSLAGYASGYLTELFDRPVVTYERECRGKGDARCIYVAKTVDEADEVQMRDLRYYQAESLATELDEAHRRIRALNETLMRSVELHKQLSNLVMEGKSLRQIVETMAGAFGRSVVVETKSRRVLAASFVCPEHEDTYRRWKPGERGAAMDSGKTGRESWTVDGVSVEACRITANHVHLGTLCMLGNPPLSHEDEMLMERAVNVCTLQMFYEQLLTESTYQMRGDFLEEIVRGRYDAETLRRRARILDLDPDTPRRLLAIKVLPREQLEDVRDALRGACRGDIISRNGYLFVFLPEAAHVQGEAGIGDFLDNLVRFVETRFKAVRVYIGCGRRAETITDLGRSYQDAIRIVDFLELSSPGESRFGLYDHLAPLMFLLRVAEQEEVLEFYQRVLGALVEYDRGHQGDLVQTLHSYLEMTGNLRRVAEAMHVSVTGLRYRLSKIEEICGVDLDDGTTRFNLQLALQIHYALHMRRRDFSGGPGTPQ